MDSTFVTRLLLTVKLNCATTCLFSTFHGEGSRTESCSTVLRISSLCQILAYVHHNFSLGTNSKTKQTKKGGGSPPLPQRNIVYKILLGKYLHFFSEFSKLFLNAKQKDFFKMDLPSHFLSCMLNNLKYLFEYALIKKFH